MLTVKVPEVNPVAAAVRVKADSLTAFLYQTVVALEPMAILAVVVLELQLELEKIFPLPTPLRVISIGEGALVAPPVES